MLSQLFDYLKTAKEDFRRRATRGDIPKGTHMPEVVNNIVWVRQLEARVTHFLAFVDSTEVVP